MVADWTTCPTLLKRLIFVFFSLKARTKPVSFFTSPPEVNLPASTWLPQLPWKFPVLQVVGLLRYVSCTAVLCEICSCQRYTELLSNKLLLRCLVCTIPEWFKNHLHTQAWPWWPATKAYLVGILKDTGLCTIATKKVTIITKNMSDLSYPRGKDFKSSGAVS